MRLNEIKKGQVYAYIDDYAKLTGRYSGACTDLPDAHPVLIVEKKKVEVKDSRDACGRVSSKRKTVVICKRFKIPASHMLALDLDVLEEKHPDLVIEDFRVEPKDVIWAWDQEVEKVRKDHLIKRELNQFYHYFQGVSARMLRWSIQENKLVLALEHLRSHTAPEDVEGRVGLGITSSYFDTFLYDICTGQFNTDTKYTYWGNTPQSDFVPRLERLGGNIDLYSYFPTWRAKGYKHSEDKSFSLTFSTTAGFDVRRALLEFLNVSDEMAQWEQAFEAAKEALGSDSPDAMIAQQTIKKLWGQVKVEVDVMCKGRKLEVVARAVQAWADACSKEFGKRLPKFQQKSWESWCANEIDKLQEMLPRGLQIRTREGVVSVI